MSIRLSKNKRAEFLELFKEFVQSYPSTQTGQKHIKSYSLVRQECHQNFQTIQAAVDRGEDVTEQVLLKFLPYVNSASNRAKGAWVHHAPSITGDLKKWYESDGTVYDWRAIADAILQFVGHCVENANKHRSIHEDCQDSGALCACGFQQDLEEACQQFTGNPHTKGFQSGFLTPILNALRPDSFLLINSKSQQVISYFTETFYARKLSQYPAINQAGRELIQELASDIEQLWDLYSYHYYLYIDDQFDLFCHWLVSIKKFMFPTIQHWKIAPGENAWQWQECQQQGFIAIGWDELGDISALSRSEFNTHRDQLIAQHPNWGWKKAGTNQVWTFAQIKPGDRIVANRGTTEVLGIGTVTGAYYYEPNATQYKHRLPVQWDDLTPRPVTQDNWRRTLIALTLEEFEQICGERAGFEQICGERSSNDAYSLDKCAEDTQLSSTTLRDWVEAIDRKGQAVLYGSPGTGKTHLARCLAKHLVSEEDGFVEFVQFHPACTYEDFMQGLRPKRVEGGLDYPLVPGRFLEFCKRASACKGRCVLIIDEINRANLAQVFGELMYLLEYREDSILLAAGEAFSISANVRILGTMNTADRSIALVDHALRRRFAFLPLYPNYEGLEKFHLSHATGCSIDKLVTFLKQINQQIGNPHYAIGTTFFLRKDLNTPLRSIWQLEIEPYLEEYFFDQPDKVEAFRWDKLEAQIKLEVQIR